MIIAVENSLAQHLHVNSQITSPSAFLDTDVWTVRVAGEFMIIMNNLMSLPVLVRYPQRFNDSRSFMTAFKREFLQLLEIAPIPHAKIRMIRDAQFNKVVFTRQIQPETQRQLQIYQNMLVGPNTVIDWERDLTNAEISLQLAEQTRVTTAADEDYVVMDLFEDYSINNFKLPAHAKLNEHNRRYLYRSLSLNDIMNATAVGEQLLDDYEKQLDHAHLSDNIIEHALDVAADYLGYCEALGESALDDLTLAYHYLINFEKLHTERPSESGFRAIGQDLRRLGRFLCREGLFSSADYDQFVQAVNQGIDSLNSKQRVYRLQRIIREMHWQVRAQRKQTMRYANQQYTVYVELANYEPKMWRRFNISGDTRLDKLCYTILAAFKANGNHLFELRQDDVRYQLPIFNSGVGTTLDMTKRWVGDCDLNKEYTLIYDLGDAWCFKIKLEAVEPVRLPSRSNPEMLAGFGNGILEDIGGVEGLTQVAKDDLKINSQFDAAGFQQEWPDLIEKIRDCYE